MNVEFKLPHLGEGVESADVAEILVGEGDTIAVDQPLVELETEKAVVPVPSPHAGTIGKVHIKEGDSIAVGQLLFTIETGGDEGKSEKAAAPASNGEKSSGAKQEKSEKPSEAPAEPKEKKSSGKPAAEETGGEGGLFEFKLPNLGEGVESADVAEVMVAVGDTIEAGQPVMELETEKAVMEVPCPEAGTIESLNVKSGDSLSVGQTILTLRTAGKSGQKAAAAPAGSAPAKSEPAKAKASESSKSSESKKASAPAAESKSTAISRPAAATEETENGHPPVPAAPSTRRLARKLGVNLRNVTGSGPGGRISQEDVEEYVKGRLEQAQLPAVSRSAGTVIVGGSLAPPPLPDFSKYGLVEREKLSKIARTAAENLTVSWNVIPHVTQHDRADITDLEAARKRFGQGIGKQGPKVTMTAVAIKALTKCLQIYPKFNASLDPETSEIVFKKFYNIGCAVDTPYGLLVPVVKDCDRKSILEIAADVTDLADKARDRKLPIDSMQGATCTVTNLGGIGGTAFTPIVNYPEVCILGMARSQKELQLVNGQVTERLLLPLALSYDHRVINGADAARFLATLCQMLSDPFQLLSAI